MRKLMIVTGLAALLGIGIAVGYGLDSESTPAPAQTTVVVGQQRPPILNAINLMKHGFNGGTSDEERQLHAQLVNGGYSYKLTADDHTERLDYWFIAANGKNIAVEYEIAPNGVHVDATQFGHSTEAWGVRCAGSIGRSALADLNALRGKVNQAASKWNADPSCTYERYSD